MEPRIYNRLLLRLFGLPVAALTILALLLGYGFQRAQQSARAVDRSDQVITHANRLIKLIVDKETGLRGYLLTHDPTFLQPMHEASQQIPVEFANLTASVHRPDQVQRLQQLKDEQHRWDQEAIQEIQSSAPPAERDSQLLAHKQNMDSLRATADEFIRAEEGIRYNRSATSLLVNRYTQAGVVVVTALVALFLAWETRELFHRLTEVYNQQIEEVRLKGEESFAREQWLSTTLRSIGDAVIACDADGNVVFMNLIAEQLTGWPEDEARGKSLHEVFPIFNEDTRATVENPVDKVRRLGTIVGLANHTFLVARDGSEICIDDSGAPIRNSAGVMIGIVLVFRDITERRMSEGALMRAEKLAAAGRLAASVAHEVNNPLEGLTNLIYIAQHTNELGEVHRLLDQAQNELGRIAHLTRQSLGFYRETTTPTHFKPSNIVREVTEFYASRADILGISLVVNTTTEAEVIGAPGELRQILSNLLANSLDACSSGHTIRIEASPGVDPRDSTRSGVRISVADTGAGILSEHLKVIFEPFFTTKKDIGTGLGLWVSRELAEKHGGSLRVRSSTSPQRSGTVFSLFLPLQGGRHASESLPTNESGLTGEGGLHLD